MLYNTLLGKVTDWGTKSRGYIWPVGCSSVKPSYTLLYTVYLGHIEHPASFPMKRPLSVIPITCQLLHLHSAERLKSSASFCRPHQLRVSARGIILDVRSGACRYNPSAYRLGGAAGAAEGGQTIKHFYRKSGLSPAAQPPHLLPQRAELTRSVCVTCCWQREVPRDEAVVNLWFKRIKIKDFLIGVGSEFLRFFSVAVDQIKGALDRKWKAQPEVHWLHVETHTARQINMMSWMRYKDRGD